MPIATRMAREWNPGEPLDLRALPERPGKRADGSVSGEFHPDRTFHAPFNGPGLPPAARWRPPRRRRLRAFWGSSRRARRIAPGYEDGWRTSRPATPSRWSTASKASTADALDPRMLAGDMQPDGRVRVDGVVIDVTDQHERAEASSSRTAALHAESARLRARSARRVPLRVALSPEGPPWIEYESVPQATFLRLPPSDVIAALDDWLAAVHPGRPDLATGGPRPRGRGHPGERRYRVVDGNGSHPLDARPLAVPARAEPRVVAEGLVSDITLAAGEDGLAAALADAEAPTPSSRSAVAAEARRTPIR